MIPIKIDLLGLVADLNEWGLRDYKIELCTGLPRGYIYQIRAGRVEEPAYTKVARLFNFHEAEGAMRVVQVRTGEAVTT